MSRELKKMYTVIFVLLVTVHSLHPANGASTKKNPDDLPIKYPGPTKDVSNRYGGDDVPDQCKNQNFCTVKPPDYPQETFNKMFKGSKSVMPPTLVIEPDIDNRQGDPNEKDNCDSTVTFEPLYKVRTKRGDWRTVVQAPEENYVQLVRLETCKEPESSCFTVFPSAPDIVTFCKQKYNVWEFLVSDGNNGTEKVKTELPVCCSCHYRPIDFASRFGKPKQ